MPTTHEQFTTLVFLLAWSAVLIAFDVYVCQSAGPDATISRVLGRLLSRPLVFGVFCFWLGLFAGHVWMPSH